MEKKSTYKNFKRIILILILLLIFSGNTVFSAKDGWSGREWRKYVENDSGQSIIEDTCQKFRNLPTLNEGGMSKEFQEDNLAIAQWLTSAETKTEQEDQELKQLIDAFMNADENGKAGKNWKLKISLDGAGSPAEDLESKYQKTVENIKKNTESTEEEQGNNENEEPKEESIDWKALSIADISNISDVVAAQDVYDALLNAHVDYEESEEVINDYVKKLIALKNSLGFKTLVSMENPYYTEKGIEEILRNIAFNDAEMLDNETLASISDKNGGDVNLNVDNTGQPLLHLYKQPDRTPSSSSSGNGLSQIISFANIFTKIGSKDQINAKELQKSINYIYNIFLQIGVGISVIIGLVLGIKFMLAGINEKAEIKKMLGVYVIACVVIFGSFGIWKLVINILGSI